MKCFLERRKGHKKGSAVDIVFTASTLLAIAVIVILVYKVSDEFNTRLQSDSTISGYAGAANARNSYTQMNNMFPGVLDNSFLLLVVGLSIVAFILAGLVRIHPVFFVFFLFLLGIIIFLCGVFSNIYQEIAEKPEFATLAENLVFITHIMKLLPFIVGTLGIVLSVIMYKTWQNG